MRREERLLLGVADASRLLLQGERADVVLPRALATLGSAALADRAYLFQNDVDADTGELLMTHRHEWVRTGISPQIGNPALVRLPYRQAMPEAWLAELEAGESLPVLVRELPPERRGVLEEQGILSLLLAPIHVTGRFWGTVGLDDCREEREWTEEERAILAVAAASIGAFVSRREAEEERRRGDERFRTLVEGAADCIWELDACGTFTYVGPSIRELTGLAPEEVIGHGPELFLAPADAVRLREFLGDLRREPRTFASLRVVIKRRDGRDVVAEAAGSPFLDAEGRVAGFRGSTRDVTERDRATRLQSALFSIADAAGASRDLPELYRRVHEILAELMPARNLYIALIDGERDWIEFPYFVDEEDVAPSSRPLGKGLTEYVFRTGHTLLASPEGFRELRDSGAVVPIGSPSVDWLGTPLKTSERTIGVLAVQSYTEGTRYSTGDARMLEFVSTHVAMAIERTRVQDERRRTLERLAEAQAIAHVGSWELLPGKVPEVLLSDEGIRLLAAPQGQAPRTLDELLGLLHPDDVGGLSAAIRRAVEEAAPFALDVRTRAGDAKARTLHVKGRPGLLEPGRVEGVVATLLDVTERKRTEAALRAATGEMTASIAELERRNVEISLLAEMGRLLLASRQAAEAHAVTARFGPRLFEGTSGALLVVEGERDTLRRVAEWGRRAPGRRASPGTTAGLSARCGRTASTAGREPSGALTPRSPSRAGRSACRSPPRATSSASSRWSAPPRSRRRGGPRRPSASRGRRPSSWPSRWRAWRSVRSCGSRRPMTRSPASSTAATSRRRWSARSGGPSGRERGWGSSFSTSTASNRSTTPSGTTRATPSCERSGPSFRRASARATSPAVTAATSSPSSSPRRTRRTSTGARRSCARRSAPSRSRA